jgi:preprotein translocase subunit YajC
MDNMWILAQSPGSESPSDLTTEPLAAEETSTTTVVSDANAPAPVAPRRRPFGGSELIIIGVMFVLMYLVLLRGPRKKQQQHKQMVQSLQKNDRVRTVGGIIGTVVDVKGDEITLKVDESNNTKIKVASSAIGKNLSKDER